MTNAIQTSPKIDRSSLIPPDQLRTLSRRSPSALASRLLFDYTLIVAAAAVCEVYWNPLVYILAVMVIGARQVGIGSIALHDGAHRMLARNKVVNDWVAQAIGFSVGMPIFEDFHGYRKQHFEHHQCTNTHDDPDGWNYEQFYAMPRWKGALLLLQALCGVIFLALFVRFLSNQWKTNKVRGLVAILCVFTVAIGYWGGVYAVQVGVLYGVIPLATWGAFVNLIRGLAEHYPENEFERGKDFPPLFRTREILNSWFDQVFVATRGVNFHLSHHLIPSVPFYNLPRLQQVLAQSETYQQYAHITRGYHQFLMEYFFKRNKPCFDAGVSQPMALNR